MSRVFPRPRTVHVHINIARDRAGQDDVFTIHTANSRAISAVRVDLDRVTGHFDHDKAKHGVTNPHINFITRAYVYDMGEGVYELRHD